MGEEITYDVNDTHRAIGEAMDKLREFDSIACDQRVKAIILTKLQEVQLWALLLIDRV